ncbi:MAG: carboxy-S-adenosyl-L-methionine synthase CmoA [Campylobacterales bacterium]|nr:carboxy-S-adenosyl-L-methionine synthase CmoA [Campylobacterales bacterium]
MIDKVFEKDIEKQFEFDENVASVFDDMLDRSVPYYKEVIKLIGFYTSTMLEKGDLVVDLGCSTANTLLYIHSLKDDLNLIGIDNSEAMLKKAKEKSKAFGAEIEFYQEDITEYLKKGVKCILSNYTLQFIRPLERENTIKKIFDSLTEGGIFLFSEKVISEDKILTKHMIDNYHKYKLDNGYSQYEISKKREALENVLIPYTENENKKMILDTGFSHIETIFKWNNFATFLAIK